MNNLVTFDGNLLIILLLVIVGAYINQRNQTLMNHYLFTYLKVRNCHEETFYNLQGNQESYEWFIESSGLGQLTPDEENSRTNKVLFPFYDQNEHLSINE